MRNYSRQREAILEVLQSTDTHPTANWVYENVRKKIPNISLGTVYRNLSNLSKSGEILSLSVGDGFEHFDGDSSPHLHLHCNDCGIISDVVLEENAFTDIAKSKGFNPTTYAYVIYGVCADCDKKEKLILEE